MSKSAKLRTIRAKTGNAASKPTARRVSKGAMGKAQASKHDQILELLRRKQGASLAEMQQASGWQAHSVRGFLAGTVKKRLGLALSSLKSKEDGERRYSVGSA